ncbi:MAG: hypothetical protein Q4G08_01365 [Capnocytophaga sp.]|nr:hypothetical protein [Capnocytophaga sp.]
MMRISRKSNYEMLFTDYVQSLPLNIFRQCEYLACGNRKSKFLGRYKQDARASKGNFGSKTKKLPL